MSLCKTLYPLLSTGSIHPNMTEKNVDCSERNQIKLTNGCIAGMNYLYKMAKTL